MFRYLLARNKREEFNCEPVAPNEKIFLTDFEWEIIDARLIITHDLIGTEVGVPYHYTTSTLLTRLVFTLL